MNLVVHINSMLQLDASSVEVKDSMATAKLQYSDYHVIVEFPLEQDKNAFLPALVASTSCPATVHSSNNDEYAQGNLLVLSKKQIGQLNAEIKALDEQKFEHEIDCMPDFDSFSLADTLPDFLNDDHWPKRTDTPACLPAMRLSSSAYEFYYGQG